VRQPPKDHAERWGLSLKSPPEVEELLARANGLFQQGMLADAEQLYRQIVDTSPNPFVALNNRGVALERLDRFDEALASIESALSIQPDYADAFYNRGIVLLRMKRFEEALTSYEQALAIRPEYAEALSNRGIAMMALHFLDGALVSFDRALALKADYAEAWYNRGIALMKLERPTEALASFDKALAIRPDYAEAFSNRGAALQALKRHDEALAVFERVLAADPNHRHALSALATSALEACDWRLTERVSPTLKRWIAEQGGFVAPFIGLFYSDDPSLQLQCARNFARHNIPVASPPPRRPARRHDRIRIAYVSADFRNHPMAHLIAELFELHDRARFEVIGISFGPEDRSDIRARVVGAFDRFHDVRSSSDRDIAALIGDLEIDIAVDLMGHTRNCRPGIFAQRGAPIQVSYLGFPGTMGVDFIDYIIADEIVLPLDQQPFYTERIVHLPATYWVNDSKLKISEHVPTRTEAGLPEQGFVFCCFNKSAKMTAPVFEVWVRLLAAVEGSVLWLLRDNAVAERNLRREAARRGIDPERLVFADKLELDRHLARHRLADLFLDTLPYNAHTTATDALQAGLPVVTCVGGTFAGRVAASLLSAIGLPELMTHSLVEYEALALRLAGDGDYRADILAKLVRNRATFPLFDTDRFRRDIEAAYTTMYERWQRGERSRPENRLL
jgi:protein O-GlcNAc transferase